MELPTVPPDPVPWQCVGTTSLPRGMQGDAPQPRWAGTPGGAENPQVDRYVLQVYWITLTQHQHSSVVCLSFLYLGNVNGK